MLRVSTTIKLEDKKGDPDATTGQPSILIWFICGWGVGTQDGQEPLGMFLAVLCS